MMENESIRFIEQAILAESNKYQRAYLKKEDFQIRKLILSKIRSLQKALLDLKAGVKA